MNITPRASRTLRTLSDQDAAAILDAADQAVRATPRRLITERISLPEGTATLTIGRPVATVGRQDAVLVAIAVQQEMEVP